jgi:agmatinase
MTSNGLFGWPQETNATQTGRFEVIGVPSDLGHSYQSGTRYGPAAIRTASLAAKVLVDGIDRGDVGSAYEQDWQDVIAEVGAEVCRILDRGSFPIILGGDHAVSYAAVAGARKFEPLNIVWFDAHTDFCSWTPAEWHNHKQVLRRIAGLPHVGQIVQIGHRGITYFDEIDEFDRLHVTRAKDAELSLTAILAALPEDQPVYMSVDIDAIDPRFAPGTGHPVPGGLRVEVLIGLAQSIIGARNVIGLDIMEVNPLLDKDNITSEVAVSILSALISCRADQAIESHNATVRQERAA